MGGESPKPAVTPTGAVFLSHASQDADAARRICDALRAAGIEVWFDQSELRGGDVWDRRIREQIHECRLFMPIISANTESRVEGYFRREWKLAVDRTHDLSERVAFLVPVVIDSTLELKADVPDAFRHVQWTRLPGGETAPAFVERVRRLLCPSAEPETVPAGVAPRSLATHPLGSASAARGTWRSIFWGLTLVAVVAIVVVYYASQWFWVGPHRGGEPPRPPTAVPGAEAIPQKSIAVLPFVDMSEHKDQEYFSDGLAEELLDLLSQVPDLRVPARSSSFYFKGRNDDIATIASKLRVAHLLEGSVRRSGKRIRVTAQLIRADNGYHLWSKTYDRDVRDIFQVQDEILTAAREPASDRQHRGVRRIPAGQQAARAGHPGIEPAGARGVPARRRPRSGLRRCLQRHRGSGVAHRRPGHRRGCGRSALARCRRACDRTRSRLTRRLLGARRLARGLRLRLDGCGERFQESARARSE